MEFDGGICKFTLQQESSTPGIRLIEPFHLGPGDYELSIRARASREDVFFLWVFDTEAKTRIGGTMHIGLDTDELSLGFSLNKATLVDVGILSHLQLVGDSCVVEFVEVNPQVVVGLGSKPLHLEPNQSASLENHPDYWEITSGQNRSTPGCRMTVAVQPGTLHAITVDLKVRSVTAAAFLWAFSRQENRELLPRVHVFSGGAGGERTCRTVFLDIPEGVEEILIGVLFSSAGLKETDKFDLFSLEIERITTLSDLVPAGYVLNLDGEEERFEYCDHILQREGFEVERWGAVRGASEPHITDFIAYSEAPFNEEDQRLGRKAIQSPGAWGYLLTMREILVDAIEKEHACIAVFDDDIILTHDFTLRFSRFVRTVPEDWEILMLGASQWNWTGLKPDHDQGWYHPNQLTNGSFAVIYHSDTFSRLIDAIDCMDSPFDSKPLKELTLASDNSRSFVAWPNIVIADVEKEGIRDSRNQYSYASRFRWKMQDFPADFKRWRSNPVLLNDHIPKDWPRAERPNIVLGVTTINRWDYLQQFITTWRRTRSNEANWTLIIADDGSTDGTIKNLIELKDSESRIVILQNSGSGIARQSNSIFEYVSKLKPIPDLIFCADDDIHFLARGWDLAYLDTVRETGLDHLVHFNPTWKPPSHNLLDERNGIELNSMTDAISCMGCFYTVTPRLLETVGGFDEAAFPIRGHSHIDFTMRSCRAGFNNIDTLLDINNACEMIGIHPKEGYTPTLRRYTYTEQMILADPNDRERRWNLVKMDDRIHVAPPLLNFLEPADHHLLILTTDSLSEDDDDAAMGFNPAIGSGSLLSRIHDTPPDSTYNQLERWSFEDGKLVMRYQDLDIWWEMPEDYVFEEAHPDLFKLAEFVLLSPFEKNILDGWIPSRQPGFRPGLAFSGGVDSTAAMALLPEQTLLMYHERTGFESMLDHSNALRFFEHLRVEKNRPVVTVLSNHELVRTLSGKSPGFVTDYACAVHVILLADHFGLDSIATGMPLENAFLWHGQKFREFEETWFWKRNAPLFESVGLQILQPVMGCSEIINRHIVEASGFGSFAQSCLRARAGESCGECWKCFRKNSILGEPIRMSREIETFLSEGRLKMAAGTIYSIQKMKGSQMYNRMYNQIMRDHPHLQEVIHADVSFLEEHYEPALNLIPERYRYFVKRKLDEVAQPITHLELIESFNMYDIHD